MPVFKVGIHLAHRSLQGAWLAPLGGGYSQVVPLRLLPAFQPKAVLSILPVRKEWEAWLAYKSI
jgi:hypothetical protein